MHHLYLRVLGILVGAPWYAVWLHIMCIYLFIFYLFIYLFNFFFFFFVMFEFVDLNQLSPVCAGALLTSHDRFQV
jgi:hypothetical protein